MVVFILYSIVGIGIYLDFYKKTEDPLNPFSVTVGILMITLGFCHIDINPLHTPVSVLTDIAIIVVCIEITIIGKIILPKTYKYGKCIERSPRITKQFYTYTIVLIAIVAFSIFIVFKRNNFNPASLQVTDSMDKKHGLDVYRGAGPLVYIANMVPYIPIYLTYILLYSKKISKLKRVICISFIGLCLTYIWIVLVSRGTLLIPVLGIMYLINNKYKFSVKTIGICFTLIIFGAGILMTYRLNAAAAVFDGRYNAIVNSFYNYVVFCYENLDKLLNRGSPFSIISTTWVSLSKVLGVYNPETIINYETYFYNAKTFIYYFYHDLGWIGIIIYPTLVYYIIGQIYVRSKYKRPQYALFIAVMYKAIAVPFFGNYFFGTFSMDVAYIFTALLLHFSYTRRFKFVFVQRKVIQSN